MGVIFVASRASPATQLTVDTTSNAARIAQYCLVGVPGQRIAVRSAMAGLPTYSRCLTGITGNGTSINFQPGAPEVLSTWVHPNYSQRRAQVVRVLINQVRGGGRARFELYRITGTDLPAANVGTTSLAVFPGPGSVGQKHDQDDPDATCFVVQVGNDNQVLTLSGLNFQDLPPPLYGFDLPGSVPAFCAINPVTDFGAVSSKPYVSLPGFYECWALATTQAVGDVADTTTTVPTYNITWWWTEQP